MGNSKIAALQSYLNLRGAYPLLVEDGVPGPVTRAAFFEVFRCRTATAITSADIQRFATRLSCKPAQLRAVAETESGGAGWDSTGLLAALYERHYGWKRFRILNTLLSNPAPGGYTVDIDHDGINDSWEKVADAALTFAEPNKAFECASWGKFQIMGAWWEQLGYSSPVDFVWRLSRSEVEHYEAFVRYIERFSLIDALRRVDGNPANCLAFARGYNGPKQKGYDGRIAANYRKLG